MSVIQERAFAFWGGRTLTPVLSLPYSHSRTLTHRPLPGGIGFPPLGFAASGNLAPEASLIFFIALVPSASIFLHSPIAAPSRSEFEFGLEHSIRTEFLLWLKCCLNRAGLELRGVSQVIASCQIISAETGCRLGPPQPQPITLTEATVWKIKKQL